MNETPTFDQYKSRFNAFILPNLIDDPNYPATSTDKSVIEAAYKRMQTYFTEDEYRKTLTTTRKNNIEAQINALLDQFQQLQSTLTTNPTQMPQTLTTVATNLQPNLDELDLRFWDPYKTYLLQGKTEEVTSHVTGIKNAAREAQDAEGKAKSILKSAGLLVSGGAEVQVANYFQQSVNGLTIQENDKLLEDESPLSPKIILISIIAIAAVLILGANLFTEVIGTFEKKNLEHYFYVLGAVGIVVAYPISAFINRLNRTQPSGYLRAATFWIIGAVLSVIGTGAYAAILLHGFKGSSNVTELVPSIVSLLAPAYLIRFCVQNYKANKHVATINQQKVITARSLLAFTSNLERADESLKLQSFTAIGDIQKNVAMTLFEPGESGFISVKEGAGSGDTLFQGSPFDRSAK